MRRLLISLLAVALVGCAKITLNTVCPATSTGVGFALSGSTVGNTVLSMLATGVTGGAIPMKLGATPAQNTSATMTYNYLPIFGSDSGNLTCTSPPQQTVVVTSPPASVVH